MIVWLLLVAAMSATFYGMGVVTGRATERRKVWAQQKTLREIGKFARQQAAVGDSTGTVISDMIDNFNDKKELN